MPILWKYIKQNNISTVSIESLRLILKRLKKAKYYKYTSYFYKQLTGIEMPFIPRDTIAEQSGTLISFIKHEKDL